MMPVKSWPWMLRAPAFALLIGERFWIGFASEQWACVVGSRELVGYWAADRIGDRAWTHDRGWWATAGHVIAKESRGEQC